MSERAEEETYSLIFSSLKHPVRRKILRLLAGAPMTFSGILGQVDVESSHLSYHLENLNGLVRKQDGEYKLSDVGRAAVSLMSKVEEPANASSLLRRSFFSLLRKSQRTWFLILLGFMLLASLVANVSLFSLNSQIYSTAGNVRWQVVDSLSFSLDALGGAYLPVPMIRQEYSNNSLIGLAIDKIVRNVDYGRKSLNQLIILDPQHEKDLLVVDELFRSFTRFSSLLSMLASQNKTAIALNLLDRLSNTINDFTIDIGSFIRSAYNVMGYVNESGLKHASEDANAVRSMIDEIMIEAVDSP